MLDTVILLSILLVLVYQNFWGKIIKIRIKNPIKEWRSRAYAKRKFMAWKEFDSYRDWIIEYYDIKEGQVPDDYQTNMIIDKRKELEKKYKIKF